MVSPLLAERIEVLRGPQSLLYGSSAVGGVVNVIDRRIPNAVPDELVHFSALADYGSAADERSVQVVSAEGSTKTVSLKTAGVAVYNNNKNLFETILDLIATPDLAFLLLTLGGLALLTEVFHPSFFAGVLGVISLIMAYFSLGALPTNWAGAGLVLFAFVLFGTEIFVHGFGVLGAGGIISLILGGIILTGSSETPGLEVSRWLQAFRRVDR